LKISRVSGVDGRRQQQEKVDMKKDPKEGRHRSALAVKLVGDSNLGIYTKASAPEGEREREEGPHVRRSA